MIRLTKGEPPERLVEKREQWEREFEAAVAAGTSSAFARYRDHAIKTAVLLETHEKCAYCESKMRAVAFGDVEHILPKAERPDLILEWTNLTLACTVCNNSKDDYFSPELPLVNPYIDEPSDHLTFLGPWVTHTLGDSRGEVTKRTLKLNRVELLERRTERLEQIRTLLDRWHAMTNAAERAVLARAIVEETADDREYAAAARELLVSHGVHAV